MTYPVMRDSIASFFRSKVIAVVGASRNANKFGNKVYHRLKGLKRYRVYPVNPLAKAVNGDRCYHSLNDLPERPDAVIFITPPIRTDAVVREALGLGIGVFWMQPGAEGPEAVRQINEAGAELVCGRCVLITDPKEFLT